MSTSKPRSTAERAAAALQEQHRAERRRQLVIVGAVVAVLAIIGGLTWFAISREDTTGETVAPSGTPANVEGYNVVVGDSGAPTTLTFYEDPQCPACRDFESQVSDAVKTGIADGKVKVEYHIVSFLDRASANTFSSRAANALYVVANAAGADAFKTFHDLLYANQPEEGTAGPENDQLVAWAVQAGADEDAVRPGIEDGAYDQFVVNSTDAWSKDGYNSTPTVLIDGKEQPDPGTAVTAVLQAVK
jgi:protein-disulfide isomerase